MKKIWWKNQQQGGFIKFILLVILIIIVMSYFHISVQQVLDWIVNAIQTIQRMFSK